MSLAPATISSVYIPVSAVVLFLNSDSKLVIPFSTKQPVYDRAAPPCGNVILLSCETEGIENLIDIKFQFSTCAGMYTQDDDGITYSLNPTEPPITDIEIQVDKAIVSSKNYFTLWGIIAEDTLKIMLLARGVVYCQVNERGEFIQIPSPEPEINFVDKEIPVGDIDGINIIFSLTDIPISGTEYVYLNGLLQQVDNDYTIVSNTITMTVPPNIGDILQVTYRK